MKGAAWPIAALLVGYPAWWALGFGGLSVIVLAVPMAVLLLRRRPIRVPRGFGLWVLLLAGYLVSGLMLGESPPGTYGELGAGRLIGYGMRLALYCSVLITVLYLGNLTERELPQLRLVRMLGVLFVSTVAGGLLGVFLPGFAYTSPVELLLPDWISGNSFVQNLIHPTAAQTQKVLGFASPGPRRRTSGPTPGAATPRCCWSGSWWAGGCTAARGAGSSWPWCSPWPPSPSCTHSTAACGSGSAWPCCT
ncbi:hypothetical protein ACFQ0B_18540 [Nonomuraea thailandensis]